MSSLSKCLRFLLIPLLFIVTHSYASSSDLDQELFDLLNAHNRIDLSQISAFLDSGADPSYYPVHDNRGQNSSLSMFIFLTGAKISDGVLSESDANDVLKMFFDKGAKLRSTDYRLIHDFAPKQNLYIQTLLEHGFDPTIRVERLSFIDRIVAEGNDEGINIVSEFGYDVPSGKDALTLKYFKAVRDYDLDGVANYLDKGVSIDALSEQGATALTEAVSMPFLDESQHEMVKFLIDKKANPNKATRGSFRISTSSQSLKNAQSLHVAIQSTSFLLGGTKRGDKKNQRYAQSVLRELIRAGAYVSGRTANGLTPLHLAAQENNVFAATLLLKNNTKVMSIDSDGNTPLDYAESSEMIRLLQKYGAQERGV